MSAEEQIAAEDVRRQLESILSSGTFALSRQLSDFLRFVVDETLEGRAQEIKQYTVATKAFGRAADFDAGTDPIVRITAQRLRRALDDYYAEEGENDTLRIHIPKGTYVPTFSRTDLQQATARDRSIRNAAPYVGKPADKPVAYGPRLAVVPFITAGATPQTEHIGDGLSEQIMNALTHFRTFTIFGPLSRERLAADQTDLTTFCREHQVRFVLDGRLRWFGDILRINAKVTDAQTSANLWSFTRDFTMTDASLLEIEDELTRQIAAAVATNDGVVARTIAHERLARPGEELETFDALLRARHATRTMDKVTLENAIQGLLQARRAEPDNIYVLSALADLYATTYIHGLYDDRQRVDDAKALALHALRLSPDSSSCHAGLAIVYWASGDGDACLRASRTARRLNPYNASMIGGLSNLFALFGAYEEGIEMAEIGLQLNPHSPAYLLYTHFIAYFATNQHVAAYRVTRDFNMPSFFGDPLFRAIAAARLGRAEEAHDNLRQLHVLRPDMLPRLTEMLQRIMGLPRHSELFLESLADVGFEPERWWELVEAAAPEEVSAELLD